MAVDTGLRAIASANRHTTALAETKATLPASPFQNILLSVKNDATIRSERTERKDGSEVHSGPAPLPVSATDSKATGTTKPTGTTDAIALPVDLRSEIASSVRAVSDTTQSGNNGIAAYATNRSAGTPNVPLYNRLYNNVYNDESILSSHLIEAPARPTDSATTQRIKQFADALRYPASIAALELGTSTNTIIAFAGLETGWGQHIPQGGGTNSNNLFGIKAHTGTQPSVTSATTEYIHGTPQVLDQRFRSYDTVGESIADFSRFLRSNSRYNEALQHAANPTRFITKIHEAGYATDPDYASKVISALEKINNITTTTGAIGIGWR